MAENLKDLKAENEQLKAENADLKKKLEYTREQFVRLMSRNLDLSDRIEGDLEFRRRVHFTTGIYKKTDYDKKQQMGGLLGQCHLNYQPS